jgi:predicted DNA-binding transcriptional regulator AlpA
MRDVGNDQPSVNTTSSTNAVQKIVEQAQGWTGYDRDRPEPDIALMEEYIKHVHSLAGETKGVIGLSRLKLSAREPLTQFEFEALCERWCIVFGEPPPIGDPADIATQPEPLPADDQMLSMKDVVRISDLSKSTIKRRVSDPTDDFPKPVKPSTRRIGWPADLVKAWRKRIESAGSDRSH